MTEKEEQIERCISLLKWIVEHPDEIDVIVQRLEELS